jgi:NAD(P)-dependent dehydrogenase (short-subunit alcohol dehydrogenase family)
MHAGVTPFEPWDEMDRAGLMAGLEGSFLGQVELVRRGADVVRQGGSFTLISSILGRAPRTQRQRRSGRQWRGRGLGARQRR